MAALMKLPIYMRIGEGLELQVATVELEPGEGIAEATEAIGQVLKQVGDEFQKKIQK